MAKYYTDEDGKIACLSEMCTEQCRNYNTCIEIENPLNTIQELKEKNEVLMDVLTLTESTIVNLLADKKDAKENAINWLRGFYTTAGKDYYNIIKKKLNEEKDKE